MHVEYSPEHACSCCVLVGDEDVEVVISRAHAEGAVVRHGGSDDQVLICARLADEEPLLFTEAMLGLLLTTMRLRHTRPRSGAYG